jgi:hypothetical protein
MPGKGQRRREKNYRAAHGGESRLPPPPKQRELDALPSKLRRLIAIQEKHKGGEKGAVAGDSSGKQGESDAAKNKARKDKVLRINFLDKHGIFKYIFLLLRCI